MGLDGGQTSPPVVLFFADNGNGLGHLTRTMAIAGQARGRFRPVVLTMSLAYQVLQDQAIPVEYFPAYHLVGLERAEWLPVVKDRVAEAVLATGARVVVVDHVNPPRRLLDLRSETSGVKWLWCRRGLWRRGANEGALGVASEFDLVLEPGDLASPIDVGATTRDRSAVARVDPIVSVQPSAYLPRVEARRHLGIPLEGRALLLNLNAPTAQELTAMLVGARRAVDAAAPGESIHLFAPRHPLRGDVSGEVEGVASAPVYPVARYMAAFDGVVSTAGYNSFHEIVASGLPAVFIPRTSTNVDDQERRARFSQLVGRAQYVQSAKLEDLRLAISRLLDPVERHVARQVTRALGPMLGAEQAADLIAEAAEDAGRRELQMFSVSGDSITSDRRGDLSDGRALGQEVIVLALLGYDADVLRQLIGRVAEAQRRRRHKFVFLIDHPTPGALVENGIAFESVMSADRWASLGAMWSYEDYIARRLEGMRLRYAARDVIRVPPEWDVRAVLNQLGFPNTQPGV